MCVMFSFNPYELASQLLTLRGENEAQLNNRYKITSHCGGRISYYTVFFLYKEDVCTGTYVFVCMCVCVRVHMHAHIYTY